jgi:hypothetical protein
MYISQLQIFGELARWFCGRRRKVEGMPCSPVRVGEVYKAEQRKPWIATDMSQNLNKQTRWVFFNCLGYRYIRTYASLRTQQNEPRKTQSGYAEISQIFDIAGHVSITTLPAEHRAYGKSVICPPRARTHAWDLTRITCGLALFLIANHKPVLGTVVEIPILRCSINE